MSLNPASLAQAVQRHGPVTRITIAGHKGSSPRETGTSMLVWATGQSGTIGGGALEFDAINQARKTTEPKLLQRPLGPTLGQCCGGHVTLLLEPITAETLTGIPDTGAYARALAPGTPEPLTIARLTAQARRGEAITPTLADGWFIEPLGAPTTSLWLYGAGHVGRAIVATTSGLPVQIAWVDDAASRFPAHIPDHASRLIATDMPRASTYAPGDAHHLILTYSHAIDLALCQAILQRPFASLGLIGSATKRGRFLKRLREMGHSAEQLARLTCPIGDPALGKHPQAIAVSVVHRLLLNASASQSGASQERSA